MYMPALLISSFTVTRDNRDRPRAFYPSYASIIGTQRSSDPVRCVQLAIWDLWSQHWFRYV